MYKGNPLNHNLENEFLTHVKENKTLAPQYTPHAEPHSMNT